MSENRTEKVTYHEQLGSEGRFLFTLTEHDDQDDFKSSLLPSNPREKLAKGAG